MMLGMNICSSFVLYLKNNHKLLVLLFLKENKKLISATAFHGLFWGLIFEINFKIWCKHEDLRPYLIQKQGFASLPDTKTRICVPTWYKNKDLRPYLILKLRIFAPFWYLTTDFRPFLILKLRIFVPTRNYETNYFRLYLILKLNWTGSDSFLTGRSSLL